MCFLICHVRIIIDDRQCIRDCFDTLINIRILEYKSRECIVVFSVQFLHCILKIRLAAGRFLNLRDCFIQRSHCINFLFGIPEIISKLYIFKSYRRICNWCNDLVIYGNLCCCIVFHTAVVNRTLHGKGCPFLPNCIIFRIYLFPGNRNKLRIKSLTQLYIIISCCPGLRRIIEGQSICNNSVRKYRSNTFSRCCFIRLNAFDAFYLDLLLCSFCNCVSTFYMRNRYLQGCRTTGLRIHFHRASCTRAINRNLVFPGNHFPFVSNILCKPFRNCRRRISSLHVFCKIFLAAYCRSHKNIILCSHRRSKCFPFTDADTYRRFCIP